MGRQINFFMHLDDLTEFTEMLVATGEVVLIPSRLTKPVIEIQEMPSPPNGTVDSLVSYIVQTSRLPDVHLRYVSKHNVWVVDDDRSMVIELLKSTISDKTIRRGRLYYTTGFYEMNGKWIEKPKDFVKWGETLFRWLRKRYERDPLTGFYIGQHAAQAVLNQQFVLKSI